MKQEALSVENEDAKDDIKDDMDSGLFLENSSAYVPLKRIDVSDAVYMHDNPIKNYLLGPLIVTRAVLENTVEEIQGLVSSLPQVGGSAVNDVQPTLESLIQMINANSELLADLTREMEELKSGQLNLLAVFLSSFGEDGESAEFQRLCLNVADLAFYVEELERHIVNKAS